jgi:hypothetical protein
VSAQQSRTPPPGALAEIQQAEIRNALARARVKITVTEQE